MMKACKPKERNAMNKLFVSVGLMMLMGLSGAVDACAAEYRPAVAAHRGASGFLPEHTIEAKVMAYAMAFFYDAA